MNYGIFSQKRFVMLCGLLAAATAVLSAQTPPATLMQIDGNAAQSGGYPSCSYGTCDYWNLLNGNGIGTPPGAEGNSIIRSFINGTTSTDSFTQGGSKDFNPLSDWRWSGSPTPNKDTLNAGYGALYQGTSNDYVLMFGADRASPNGDANIGIWFFQSAVSLNPNGTFNGSHMDGDVFVISAFVGGGGTSAVSVYEWDHTCLKGVKNPTSGQCADANLRLKISQPSSSSCGSALACAVTNAVTTNSTWEGPLASPLFFQGGVNLNAVLGAENLPCFASFLEETRSSQSTSAVLKDFLLGGFPVCGMKITKQCDAANSGSIVNGGTQIHYAWKGTVQNTGIGTLDNVVITDTLPDSSVVHPTLMVNGLASTSLGPNETGNYSVTFDMAGLSATNNATASSSTGGTTVNADAPAQATCTANVSSAVSVVKSCVAPGPVLNCTSSGCVVQVNFSAHVCNTGNTKLTNITLADTPNAMFSSSSISSLFPAGSVDGQGNPTDCADVTGHYTPTNTNVTGDGATNGRYTFSDIVSVTGATPALGGALPPAPGAANCPNATDLACSKAMCPLCNAGECVTQ
ncbi:MAG: hypothetical protein KGN79_09200 [Acidobacteriota bacterium]|nr:hypothetical protein [Acidobacteriota bacterium]